MQCPFCRGNFAKYRQVVPCFDLNVVDRLKSEKKMLAKNIKNDSGLMQSQVTGSKTR